MSNCKEIKKQRNNIMTKYLSSISWNTIISKQK